jgi:hypothetical protein
MTVCRRILVSLACLYGLILPFAPASADDQADQIKAGKALLKEGDALADKGETSEAVLRYKSAFEILLPTMRKLPFKSVVNRDVTAREDMKKMLIKEIDADMTPEEFRAGELGMKALGFVPADFKLKEALVQVYSEEIAAFYDPKTKTMHLIKEPEEKLKKPPTPFERLMGKKGGFDKDENKTVIAHEMTHALDDQHFDIDRMQKAIKHNDDLDLALSSLIEGEATLTMQAASMEDWDGTEIVKVPSSVLDSMTTFLTPMLPAAGGKSLREAPVILSESMIFPYLRGLVFCSRLTNDGGWAALNEAYKRPPLSTEQILHPEKYKTKPDRPMAIDLGKLDAGESWKELGQNVVGEMQLGVLLRRHGGKRAAAGWDGDRFAVFEGPERKLGLVWFTTWDSEKDANEFLEGYAGFQFTKLWEGTERIIGAASSVRRTKNGIVYAIEGQGSDVVVVEGFSGSTTDRLVEAAWKARKSEMTYESLAPALPDNKPAETK